MHFNTKQNLATMGDSNPHSGVIFMAPPLSLQNAKTYNFHKNQPFPRHRVFPNAVHNCLSLMIARCKKDFIIWG